MMADVPTSSDWLQVLLGLPPPLQGIAVAAAGAVASYFLWHRFRASYASPEPEAKGELLVGESATFADLKPVKDLTDQASLLTMQLMKNEVQMASFVSGISETTRAMIAARVEAMERQDKSQTELMQALRELADLLAQHLVDLRTEREEREDRERENAAREEGRNAGYQQAMSEQRKTRPVRRPRTKKP